MKALIFLIFFIFSSSIGVLAADDHDHDHDHDHCHSKEDHNDDHTGYFETIRINTIKSGKTQENVISAVNEYLEVVEESKFRFISLTENLIVLIKEMISLNLWDFSMKLLKSISLQEHGELQAVLPLHLLKEPARLHI